MDLDDILNSGLSDLVREHDMKQHPEKYKTPQQLLAEKSVENLKISRQYSQQQVALQQKQAQQQMQQLIYQQLQHQ